MKLTIKTVDGIVQPDGTIEYRNQSPFLLLSFPDTIKPEFETVEHLEFLKPLFKLGAESVSGFDGFTNDVTFEPVDPHRESPRVKLQIAFLDEIYIGQNNL